MSIYETQKETLRLHIEKLNAEHIETCKAQGATARMTWHTDMDDWMKSGTTTPELFDRRALQGEAWDLYKDIHGIRPRWVDFDAMTIAEIQEFIDSELSVEADRQASNEKYEAECKEAESAPLTQKHNVTDGVFGSLLSEALTA
jgi:hypothetical protein